MHYAEHFAQHYLTYTLHSDSEVSTYSDSEVFHSLASLVSYARARAPYSLAVV